MHVFLKMKVIHKLHNVPFGIFTIWLPILIPFPLQQNQNDQWSARGRSSYCFCRGYFSWCSIWDSSMGSLWYHFKCCWKFMVCCYLSHFSIRFSLMTVSWCSKFKQKYKRREKNLATIDALNSVAGSVVGWCLVNLFSLIVDCTTTWKLFQGFWALLWLTKLEFGVSW